MAIPVGCPDDAGSKENVLAIVGEHRLLAVLLREALHTVAARGRDATLHRTRTWICAREPGRRLSFEHACRAFDLDANRVRRRLGLRAQVARRRTAPGFRRAGR